MVTPNVGFNLEGFSVKNKTDNRNIAKQIISIPDEQLAMISYAQTADKYEKKNKNLAKAGTALLTAIPVATGVATALNADKKVLTLANNAGIIKKTLNGVEKTILGAKTGAYVGAELGGFFVANKIYNKVTDKVPFLKKFKEESPTLSTLTSLAATLFGGEAIAKGAAKAGRKISNTNFIQNLNIPKKIGNALESVKKHIPEKIANFATKHSAGIKTASKAIVPLAIVGYIAANIVNQVKQNKEAENLYQEAKDLKAQTAVDYANDLEAENYLNKVAVEALLTDESNTESEE